MKTKPTCLVTAHVFKNDSPTYEDGFSYRDGLLQTPGMFYDTYWFLAWKGKDISCPTMFPSKEFLHED